jgi:transcriptional regulator with XRE-family HTH domain
MILLLQYRKKFNYTQQYIADVLQVTQSQYSKFELGKSLLNTDQLMKICRLYRCTPNDLFDFKDQYLAMMNELDQD